MTDKQIIIDGVDVSGCGFYHFVTGTECHIALAFAEEYTDNDHTYLKCEQNPNCNYKQKEKYKNALKEIKEICNNNDELKGKFNLIDCDKYKLGKHNLAQKIIAKINEVEDEHKRKN